MDIRTFFVTQDREKSTDSVEESVAQESTDSVEGAAAQEPTDSVTNFVHGSPPQPSVLLCTKWMTCMRLKQCILKT